MKKLLMVVTTACLVLGSEHAWAQGRVVTGTVTSDAGRPIAGVVVTVKGTNVRAVTDETGRYSINVPTGAQQLVFSGQAVATEEAAISGNTVNVSLGAQAVALEGLVVTALGITRAERSVSTSVTQVEGSALTQTPQTNLVSALSGQVSGVQVTTAGPQGGSARVVIRGSNSITGNNQPLFVVDGVPIDNSAPRLYGGHVGLSNNYTNIDYGNAAGDVNPHDIESISVLKGPNAAALYGSRAANGAIIITTKSGKSRGAGLGITASTSVTRDTPLKLPGYQNQFGQGCYGEFLYVDGNYGGVCDGTDESWGPALDGSVRNQWFGQGPWQAHPNNVRQFWEDGLTQSYNAAVTGNAENANMRVSLSHLNQDGMGPGFEMEQTSASLNGGAKIGERFNVDATVQYINRDGRNRYGTGYEGDNPMLQFIWFGRQNDIGQLRQAYNANPGEMVNWNYSYHSNPYWLSLENGNSDTRDRVIGSVAGTYRFTDWLNATLRSGTDWYREGRERTWAGGTIGLDHVGQVGTFASDQIYSQETNTDLLVTADRDLTSDFNITASVGGGRRDERYNLNQVFVPELNTPGLFTVANAALLPQTQDERQRKRVNSVYGQATFGFRDVAFLDVTGRNDWSSTLPEGNNSYFYPSVSGSFIFSDAFPTSIPGFLTYGKVRASWARVGNDAAPYQLAPTHYWQQPFGGIPGYATGNLLPNPTLRPEETTSFEIGTELRFFDDRAGIDVTYYDRESTDQIVQVQVSPASGFSHQLVNAGVMTNNGIDVGLNLTPVRRGDFEWDMRASYNKNNNKVVALPAGVDALTLGTFWSVNVQARVGQPYGALFGTTQMRDSVSGLPILDGGMPLPGPSAVIGNYNPDWIGSFSNTFRFRNLNMSVLVDGRKGGDIFSVTNMFGRYAGVLKETAGNRCVDEEVKGSGLPVCGSTPGAGITVTGIDATTGKQTTYNGVNAQDYWQSQYGIHDMHLEDGSFVKLREVTLGYTVPQRFTRRMGVSGLNLSVTGRNLWMWAEADHIDPETAFDASNAQGFEFGQLPTARSIGFNLSFTP
ncbi:MAG TPA: SusC/RagA family TonB-linked outer membrane protein [Longimicrobiaceae bacterium]|nr:SusC/RagA family TonB-linked outer membrane protein [Longimicrobiaceae bacterium]